MSISTNPIKKPYAFGKVLKGTPDGHFLLVRDPGGFPDETFLPAEKVSDELKSLMAVCGTDTIGTDMFDVWHPMMPTAAYTSRKREADVSRLEAEARAARAELELERALLAERTRETEEQRRRRLAAESVGELIGSLAGALHRRRW